MSYIENPKTKGSGIICCIPQKGRCPRGCADCFFQSGRSYLEPLDEKTPNMPTVKEVGDRVVRVNDGNDSNHQRTLVFADTQRYPHRFYNTSSQDYLVGYGAPVVLTVNPAEMTDVEYHQLSHPGPSNLMFVRVRANTWNLKLVDAVVAWYTGVLKIPVVLTFLAYWKDTKGISEAKAVAMGYTFRQRTTNSYWAIKTEAWRRVMAIYEHNPLVHSCGSEGISTACRHCGNCLREYYATIERIRTNGKG